MRTRLLDRAWVAPVAAGAGGTLLTSLAIGVPAPWRDEQATAAAAASRTWPQLVDLVTGSTDAVSALYYALMHLWVGLVGVDPFWLRLPSAVAVGVAAAGLVVLGRQLDRTRTGLFAAAVLVLLPRVFWAGGEARSYALQIAAAVWLTVLFVDAIRKGRWVRWVLFAVATAVANWLFLYLALVGVAQVVTLAIVPEWRRRLLPAILAVGAAALASLPIAILGYGQRGQISWVPPVGPGVVGSVIREQWFMGSTIFSVVAWVLVVAGVVVIARRRAGNATARQLLALLIPWLLLPTIALVAISLVASPVYLDRYLVMSAPAVALLGAFALGRLPLIAGVAALVLVTAAAVAPAIQVRMPDAKGDWREVAALVESGSDPGDAVYFSTDPYGDELRGLETFYPGAFEGLDDIALLEPAAEAGLLRDRVLPASEAAAELGDDQVLVTVLGDADAPANEDRETFVRLGLVETVVGDTGSTTVSTWRR